MLFFLYDFVTQGTLHSSIGHDMTLHNTALRIPTLTFFNYLNVLPLYMAIVYY